ncbi:molybdate ABC transporter ATP-binding protein ModF [Rosenbergiella australiborealis]|uniref:Molybdate ABC transporter ATP-binding protein ModF n=1 Tax=Rosenbergiella australiborealis TaxID=1544696 RepID=A0ABS5T3V0_9GAMM|nr:molybdate ABC transporter ATP-binding protein ModF [Rosenbergiella australiborealis]MBT0727030.1 molybdate ABC transporter ATP-binding protein ModF [Rosenbergiella australiborealis]
MKILHISQCRFYRGERWQLQIDEFTLTEGESVALVGSNGSGKSSLTLALKGELTSAKGTWLSQFTSVTRLSFEQLSAFVNQEWEKNNSDLFSEGENSDGKLTRDVIQESYQDPVRCEALAERFGIRALLDRPFKVLSTGETRKTLLCQALMSEPDLLILDEPFDGLDIDARAALQQLLYELHQQGLTLILVLNRFDDIPTFVSRVGILIEGTLHPLAAREKVLADNIVTQLQHLETLHIEQLPEADIPSVSEDQTNTSTLIRLQSGRVSWDDNVIIDNLTWQVNPGEHWQITGPNGAGKSTLLSLITGDHPQGYSNDLTLFGIRRGSGETLWDIKKHIGYVSSSLHLDYRVSASIRTVVLSGYFDSIGLYQVPGDRQQALAEQWLSLIGISGEQANQPFHDLSWGQQRLVLIVRALVKHPRLLILDEPLQGLDALNRQLIKQFVSILIAQGSTQLLFVSHHAEDAPSCITHRLRFVPKPEGGYGYEQRAVD